MRLLHLPTVLDAARLEGPIQHAAVERLEGRRVSHLVGDVRKFAWSTAIESRARLTGNRLEHGERRTLRVGGAKDGAEVELLRFVDGAAAVQDGLARALQISDRIAAEQRARSGHAEDPDVL